MGARNTIDGAASAVSPATSAPSEDRLANSAAAEAESSRMAASSRAVRRIWVGAASASPSRTEVTGAKMAPTTAVST